jgi:putative SOS response-associated peptidase YedK|nr:SOS response-associated peptidase [Kofleriaceae bacterium]
MCGRYTLTNQDDVVTDLQVALDLTAGSEWWRPRFNVAPTQLAPVVALRDGVRALEMMRWGLLPFSAASARHALMINARVETAFTRPPFRDLAARATTRCLVPADGFFEWVKRGKQAFPKFIHPEPRRTIAFAGLWAHDSFTILTGPPNELVAPIHDRMPIVLPREAWDDWLAPATEVASARALLRVPATAGWVVEPVSARVNSPANDDAACIAREDEPPPIQGSLF